MPIIGRRGARNIVITLPGPRVSAHRPRAVIAPANAYGAAAVCTCCGGSARSVRSPTMVATTSTAAQMP